MMSILIFRFASIENFFYRKNIYRLAFSSEMRFLLQAIVCFLSSFILGDFSKSRSKAGFILPSCFLIKYKIWR